MRRFWVLAIISALTAAGVWWVLQAPDTPAFRPSTTESPDGDRQAAGERPGNAVDEVVRIAVIAPLSGLPAGIQSALPNVARFFTDRINAEGGLLGRSVDLTILDNANTALGARTAAEKAADLKVAAVIGGQRSSNALTMAGVLQAAAIPMIAVGASHPDITRTGDYIFRINYTDTFQGAALARFARNDLKAASAVLMVNIGNSYSPYLADVFAEQFQQLGGSVLMRQEYLPDVETFDRAAASFYAAGPDVIFLPGYQEDSARMIAAARRAGVESVFIGADGWDVSIPRAVGAAAEGACFSAHWHPDAEMGGGLSDAVAALAAHKEAPIGDVEMLAVDAVHLLFDAIRRAGRTDPEAIRDALARTEEFVGACGPYRFDRNGDPEKSLAILRFEGERSTFLTTIRPETVRFGLIFAETGDAASAVRAMFEGSRFAADEINLRGGVLARQIELIVYDNESTALGSRRAAEAAVQDGVCGVVGAVWSSHSSAMAPILEAAGIPMVTPASTNPAITRDRPHVFRTCYTDRLQGEAMARFALSALGAETAAVMVNADNRYSVDLARFFTRRFQQDGRIVVEADYLQSDNDFTPHLSDIQRASPDVVCIPGYTRDAAFIIRQARSMGIESVFIGGDGWDDLMYEYAGDALAGSYFADHWHVDLPDPRSKAFAASYEAEHVRRPSSLAALSYDTVHLLTDAIRRAGSTAPKVIRQALADTRDFKGITGTITFDDNGDPEKPVVMIRFGSDATVFDRFM